MCWFSLALSIHNHLSTRMIFNHVEVVDSPVGCDTLRLLVHGPNLSRSKSAKTKVTETALGVTTS